MADPVLLTRLGQHRALGGAPANEHVWLAEHGVLRAFAAGGVVRVHICADLAERPQVSVASC